MPSGGRLERGLADTSTIIDLELLDPKDLPLEIAISSITLAELTAGPLATDDPTERTHRQDRLQRTEATFNPIPFGVEAARAYGRIFAIAASSGKEPRAQRAVDLLIAATALAEDLPLITRNGEDFAMVAELIDLVVV